MKKQITRISPFQTAKILAALSLVSAVPFWLLMMIPMMAMPGPRPPFFGGLLLFMPLLYAIFGFVFVIVGAWLYNLLARYIGGIEFTSIEVEENS